MALNNFQMLSNGIKIAFFKDLQKNRLAAGCSASRPPSVIRFSYTSLLNASPYSDIFTFSLLVQALSHLQNPG